MDSENFLTHPFSTQELQKDIKEIKLEITRQLDWTILVLRKSNISYRENRRGLDLMNNRTKNMQIPRLEDSSCCRLTDPGKDHLIYC